MKSTTAIYVHWPFCKAKCPYCDFNSHVQKTIDKDQWLKSYLSEIDYFADYLQSKNIGSIFFGGGTPTLMSPSIVENIIAHLAKYSTLADDIEITLEGNPTSIEADKLVHFKNAGINRVSLGVQSLNDKSLAFLGREHSVSEALKAVETASGIFDNYSFDLIYALPSQTLDQWEQELRSALKYARHHMSLYQLTIEKGTPFYGQHKKGDFSMPKEELAAEFYELTNSIMNDAGLLAYEISNHAKPGIESRHNLTYWRYGDYLGIGPGAHSRITQNGKKYSMVMIHSPNSWLKSIENNGHAIQNQIPLTKTDILEEMVTMGLRIKSGIDRNHFQEITRATPEESLHNVEQMQDADLLELDDTGLRLTNKGTLLANSVIAKLLVG